MLVQKKSKLTIMIENKKFVITANLIFTTRQVVFTLMLIIMLGLLALALLDNGLKKYALEIFIGILQPILAEYISRK